MLRLLCLFMVCAHATCAAELKIITTIPYVQGLVEAVTHGAQKPILLAAGGEAGHHFSLRPSHLRLAASADIMVRIGDDADPWSDNIAAKFPELTVITLSEISGTSARFTRAPGVFSANAEAAPAEIDPHRWLDPVNAELWLHDLVNTLASLDPENREIYAKNATEVIDWLIDFRAEAETTLAPLQDVPFVINHDALSYFEARFGLTSLGSVSDAHDREAGPASLASLRDAALAAGEVCIINHPEHPSVVLSNLLQDTYHVTIDPMGMDIEPDADFLVTYYSNLVKHFAECLSH